ncbi:DUF4258 domain-containing protein [candidate division WOR-3 bacterium]|nr:DUF4258 domain-containing protein [candidate division WOR-3 bacterium]
MFDKPAGGTVLARIRVLARDERVRVTVHAHQEMVEEDVTMDELLRAASSADIIEDYPEHRRGPCCLLHGVTATGRHLHVVCTTSQEMLVVITVYEPRPPKWPEPTVRRRL